jgi:hypothetical protein
MSSAVSSFKQLGSKRVNASLFRNITLILVSAEASRYNLYNPIKLGYDSDPFIVIGVRFSVASMTKICDSFNSAKKNGIVWHLPDSCLQTSLEWREPSEKVKYVELSINTVVVSLLHRVLSVQWCLSTLVR